MDTPIVIGAAGKGTRMGELTKDRPKHLIPVAGRPFVTHVLAVVRAAGYTDITVVAGYFADQLAAFVKTLPFPVRIVDQFAQFGEDRYGTAIAVQAAKTAVGERPFVFMNGDNLYTALDVRAVGEGTGTAIVGMPHDRPSAYGVLVVRADETLERIEEKPETPPSNLINVGLYRFAPDIFPLIERLAPSPRGEYELTDAINAIARRELVRVLRLQGDWMDFGKPEDIGRMETYLKTHGSVSPV
jgi:bifunctional UDP-N-acetylglucosamine pyrophosphorylase/glucosamine-1-phosphate N-acetyltransferase